MQKELEEPQILKVNEKQDVSYCIPLWLRDEQIRASIKRIPGRIQPGPKREDPVAVVCFGPSLRETWEKVKEFKYVVSCSGSHKFLVERGIIPTWHVEVDPREHKVKLIGQPQKETEYLIASACHPKVFDHLEGYNVKLWHVFDMSDSSRILPHGDWAITGGCGVGLRAMTIAGFLGFTDLHIFGMDGSEASDGKKHADTHPNEPKKYNLVEYPEGSGTFYKTTASMLEAARSTFHELDQLPHLKATFYGEGLVQSMAKDYKPRPSGHKFKNVDAFQKPELISTKYREMNAKLHIDNVLYGTTSRNHVDTVIAMAKAAGTQSILDYGCGKGLLAKSMPYPIWEYDPAIPGKEESPRPAEMVVCIDVLEHVEPDKLSFVLEDLKRCTLKVGYFTINTLPSSKQYEDGSNAHLIQKDEAWWRAKLSKSFDVASIQDVKGQLHVVVAPLKNGKADQGMSVTAVAGVNFYTPNDTTKWRARTLLTKEPVTVDWINSMKAGDVLFDIGANVGGYTVLAGSKGVRVYAFEPEADNYALLIKNMVLNNLEPNAYCVAISNRLNVNTLNINKPGAGSSCHLFGEALDSKSHQGALGISVDDLMKSGLPQPDHIKIDVDGLEYNVIHGAVETLKNVKTLLVEVDTNSVAHLGMIEELKSMGFSYDNGQVDRAMRKDGPFKGCAEYLFTRNSVNRHDHLRQSIGRAEVIQFPTPYIYVENIFPETLYKEILENLPKHYEPIGKYRNTKGYGKRTIAMPETPFWVELINKLRDGNLRKLLCEKFSIDPEGLTDEVLLIRDMPGYKIGPHTDNPMKRISALFYLPSDDSQIECGTSLYTPKQQGFTCPGGPHHKYEKFNLVSTMPFKPNSLFAFLKTDTSFHGVEPYNGTKPRDVLLYDVRKQ